jgi:2-beta-glucuronyltransferase
MNKKPSFLIITRQDQRTRRKVNIHFIAEEFAKLGKTRIFSFAFSWLSRIKKDQRVELWNECNKPVMFEGVECYLWRNLLHPVNLRKAALAPLERLLFAAYKKMVPSLLYQWIRESDYIIFESGFPNMLIELCKKTNPSAKLIYLASDSLHTIDCAKSIVNHFQTAGPLLDYCILPSRKLAEEMPKGCPSYFVPHGLDKSILQHVDPSPYTCGVNIVSVGSMLFDHTFFEIAANAFPDITFHVIGGGANADNIKAENVKIYGEMPFLETIPYLYHANAGVAPYNGEKVSPFLVDTSMKLMQYGFLGTPAICPHTTVGNYAGRFGYTPGDKQSIVAAVKNALSSGRFESAPTLSWEDAAKRIIAPKTYPDTLI